MIDGVWEVDVELISNWLLSLESNDYDQVIAALTLLRDRGPALGRPIVDTVTASRLRNMKELRPGSSGRSEIRILFAFDPERRAVMLLAGDKSGAWRRWYRDNVPRADALFEAHLKQLEET